MSDTDNEKDSQKTERLDAPGHTANIPAVSDATRALEALPQDELEDGGTRAFPAIIADDSQAPDMTVMLAEEFSSLVGKGEETTKLPIKPGKHSKLTDDVLQDEALTPGGETDILPFTPKYFEQFENGEMPHDALDPKTSDPNEPASPSEPEPEQGPSEADREKKKRRTTIIIVIVSIIIALAAAATAIWFIHQRQVHDAAMLAHPIELQIKAPNYDWADSKIPLHVEGIDMEGTYVDKIAYVDVQGQGLELVRGDYNVKVVASPLLDSAELYKVPNASLRIEIPETLGTGLAYAPDPTNIITLELAALTEITDEDINNAYSYAIDSGFDKGKADAYKAALITRRDADVAAMKAETERTERISTASTALEDYAKSKGSKGISYKITDLDGDGIPEMLLAGNAESNVGSMCFVYAYDVQNHRVVELCSAPGGADAAPFIKYSTGAHEVVLRTTTSNSEKYMFYKITTTSATSEHVYSHEESKSSRSASGSSSDSTSSKDTYYLDGKKISEKAYKDMIDKIRKYETVSSPG